MALSAIGALLILGLALFIQTPALARRAGLPVSVRSLTGYAFALILLLIGFFVAGVPLGNSAEPGTTANVPSTPTSQFDNVVILPSPTLEATGAEEAVTPAPLTPVTGAFGGPPPLQATLTLTNTGETGNAAATSAPDDTSSSTPRPTNAPTTTPTQTPTPTPSNTPTPTPSPTQTPTPTRTPTPISGPTALVNTDGSTLFIRRYPGGSQTIGLLNQGDTVLLLPGRANQGGILWQEISTVDGLEGWVQYEFLAFE